MHRNQIPIAMSCGESWEKMNGDARRRFCGSCQHDVVNLSRLTEQEAHKVLLEATTTRVCVRYAFDAEGNVQFRPPPREPAPILRTHLAASAIAAGSLLTGCASVATNQTSIGSAPTNATMPMSCPVVPHANAPVTPAPVEGNASNAKPMGVVAGVVFDAITCTPAADVVVIVSGPGLLEGDAVVVTQQDGTFRVPNVPPGETYTVAFEGGQYKSMARGGISVQAGNEAWMQISMQQDLSATTETMGVICVQSAVNTTESGRKVRAEKDEIRRLPLVR